MKISDHGIFKLDFCDVFLEKDQTSTRSENALITGEERLTSQEGKGMQTQPCCSIISHVTRKPVFRVCDQARHKAASSATETSYFGFSKDRYYTIFAANSQGVDVQAVLHLCCSDMA